MKLWSLVIYLFQQIITKRCHATVSIGKANRDVQKLMAIVTISLITYPNCRDGRSLLIQDSISLRATSNRGLMTPH